MKKITQLLVSGLLLLLLNACGQKGPLILESPTTKTASVSNQNVEKTEVEVPQGDPVLKIQTDETSTAR